MSKHIRLLPYKMGSASGKALAAGLDVRRVYPDRKYKPKPKHTVINWGFKGQVNWDVKDCNWLNKPFNVGVATNKADCLEKLANAGVNTVPFTRSQSTAESWQRDGDIVVERHVLSGHSGQGIELKGLGDPISGCPLYTKYTAKCREYRVHVLPDGSAVLNQKRRRTDVPDDEVNWQVRNYDNGFTYCRDNVQPCDEAIDAARRAVTVLGLDFGAVDVLYRAKTGATYILEVNTAPGLEGSMLETYINSFRSVS